MDWRLLVLITVLSWGGYSVILKAVAGRIAWQVSMLVFAVGYLVAILLYLFGSMSRGEVRVCQLMSLWPLGAGLLCGVGAIAFFKAVPQAKGSVMMPLVGLYVLVSAVGCMIALHEPVTVRVVAGILCATAAVVLLGG